MAATPYAANQTRTHWAGANADLDIHIEAYEGEIDGSFRVGSLFRSAGLTTFRSVQNQSNAYRIDRVGGASVSGRRNGETLDPKRIPNDKLVITVDTTSYIRTPFDYQDDWTSPDFTAEYAAEHGTAHAKAFDQAHIIQLIKAGDWVAPAALKTSGAFFDGYKDTMTGYAAETDAESKADYIVAAHKKALAAFVNRDLGGSLGELVTLMKPEVFNVLLDHKKLMNVEFQGGNGYNDFSQRRIAVLNGIRVIETPRFPSAAITNHILGPQFNVSSTEAKAAFILFHPRKTLVTVEAHGMTVRQWDDPKDFQSVLDSYHMYTVGIRRGDATAVVYTD
jgi:hypothetical protein